MNLQILTPNNIQAPSLSEPRSARPAASHRALRQRRVLRGVRTGATWHRPIAPTRRTAVGRTHRRQLPRACVWYHTDEQLARRAEEVSRADRCARCDV